MEHEPIRINNPEALHDTAISILRKQGFENINSLEGTGPDGGRDIEATTKSRNEAGFCPELKWWIQLKFRSENSYLDIDEINKGVKRTKENGAHYYLLITNSKLGVKNRERLSKTAQTEGVIFHVWDTHWISFLYATQKQPRNRTPLLLATQIQDTYRLEKLIRPGNYSVIFINSSIGIGNAPLTQELFRQLKQDYTCGVIDSRPKGEWAFSFRKLANEMQNQACNTPFSYTASQRMQEDERLDFFLDHCKTRKTILVLDHFEEMLNKSGIIAHPESFKLVNYFLSYPMQGSILLISSHAPLQDRRITSQKGFKEYTPQEWNSDSCNLINQLPTNDDEAQRLVETLSRQPNTKQTQALNRFAQFDRSMTENEIINFVCTNEILYSLIEKQLIEPCDSGAEQYQLHPIAAERFSLMAQPDERRILVLDLTNKIQKFVNKSQGGIDEENNHMLLRQAARMLILVGETETAGNILVQIGTRAVSMGDVKYLEEALKAVRGRISSLLEAKLLKIQGHIEDLLGQYKQAKATYQQMLDLGVDLNDNWVRSAALNGLGTMERHGGRFYHAITFYRESLALRQDRSNPDIVGQSNSLHNLGASYLELGQMHHAQKHLTEALKLRKKLNDQFRMSATQIYLGECHCYSGEYSEARKVINTAIETKNRFDDAVGILWARLLLAKIDLLASDRNDENLRNNLAWCRERAKQLNKTRDIMLGAAFSGVHSLLTNLDETEAFHYLTDARKLADALNQEQSTLLKQLITALAKNIEATETIPEIMSEIAKTAHTLVLRLKI